MSWIRNPVPRPRRRLICLPYAGGGSVDYRQWKGHLPGDLALDPVVLPGRESRLSERPINRMADLIGPLVEAVTPLIRHTPYAIYGHSMGAWVGFELMRALRQLHRPLPVHFFAAARRAPDLPATLPPLGGLPDPAFITAMQERYGGIPKVLFEEPEIMRLFVPAMKADVQLLDAFTYVEEAPLPVPFTVIGGTRDDRTRPDELRAWKAHTAEAFRVRQIDGGHFFLKDRRAEVTALITATLASDGR